MYMLAGLYAVTLVLAFLEAADGERAAAAGVLCTPGWMALSARTCSALLVFQWLLFWDTL